MMTSSHHTYLLKILASALYCFSAASCSFTIFPIAQLCVILRAMLINVLSPHNDANSLAMYTCNHAFCVCDISQ